LAAAPLAAQESEPAAAGALAEAEPAAAAEEAPDPTYIFGTALEVTGELPWIPSSNTVAAKLPLPLRETPASVAVVPGPLLAEQGATVLGDALENVSGLGVHTGSGVFDFFVVRGFDSVSSGLILSDGAPELETTFYQLYNVERAEVFKGPTSFLYGGGPLAGTVNLVRKQPLPGAFGRITAGAGSFDTREATADANLAAADGSLAFRVNGLWRESDGHRDGRASDLAAVNPALTWRPRENHSLNLNLERVEADFSPDNGLPLLFDARGVATVVPDVPRERSYQSPLDVSDQTIDRLQLDWEAILSPTLIVRDKAYRRTMDWRSRATIFNGVFPVPFAGDLVARSLLLLDDEQELTGNQLELVASLGGGAVSHELLVGVEAVRYRDRFGFDVALLPLIGLENPIETAPGSIDLLPRIPGQAMAADAESVVVAPYAIDQISIGDSLRLLVGARWDEIDFEDAAAGTARDDGELSPMLGAVWAPAPDLSLYASYGEAFSPPSTFTPAPDRVPEDSAQGEAGVKAALWGGRAEATLAAFRIDREGVAIPDATGVVRQIGDQRSRGLEAELRGTVGGDGPRWRSGLRYLFAYAYTESELTTYRETQFLPVPPFVVVRDFSGQDAPFTPEHVASLWLSTGVADGLGLGAGARWVADQFIDEDNEFAIDGYATLAAAAWWERGRFKLRLNLDNLTDEEYLTRGFGGSSVIPAPGRAATARLEVGLR
jgi:TonB-dependent siderophore receptor